MQKEYVVLEGKIFVVELLSYMGSTNYGWCISKLPQQIIVMATENVPVGGKYSATLLQRFYFGALATEEEKVDISFTLNSWSDLDDVVDNFTANVKIIKSDSEDFASYSENAVKIAMPYGFVRPDDGTQNSCQDYGLPCIGHQDFNHLIVAYGVPLGQDFKNLNMACEPIYMGQNANLKYGYPCGVQDASLKYGYPCGVQDASLKYGYPCGVQEASLKYGYPCGVQEANLKYGYPCSVQKYGYPCGVQEASLKYGYPCGVQEASLKYGYPCGVQEASLKYGYPCGVQETSLTYDDPYNVQKYGYPCGVQDANLKYGYPCSVQKYGYPCGVQDSQEARIYAVPF